MNGVIKVHKLRATVKVATIDGDIVLGGLMMVHERHSQYVCGKVMPQGGIQATEAMLYTIDYINRAGLIPGVRLGARIKDDCDRDTYGLEQSIDFIRGTYYKASSATRCPQQQQQQQTGHEPVNAAAGGRARAQSKSVVVETGGGATRTHVYIHFKTNGTRATGTTHHAERSPFSSSGVVCDFLRK